MRKLCVSEREGAKFSHAGSHFFVKFVNVIYSDGFFSLLAHNFESQIRPLSLSFLFIYFLSMCLCSLICLLKLVVLMYAAFCYWWVSELTTGIASDATGFMCGHIRSLAALPTPVEPSNHLTNCHRSTSDRPCQCRERGRETKSTDWSKLSTHKQRMKTKYCHYLHFYWFIDIYTRTQYTRNTYSQCFWYCPYWDRLARTVHTDCLFSFQIIRSYFEFIMIFPLCESRACHEICQTTYLMSHSNTWNGIWNWMRQIKEVDKDTWHHYAFSLFGWVQMKLKF